MPLVRLDDDDEVYRTATEKYRAIIDADRGLQEARPAGAGRHHLDREVRAARRDAAPGRAGSSTTSPIPNAFAALYSGDDGATQDQGVRHPQRALSRAGSLYRRRRPACRARSRSRPTWPAAAPTSSSAAMPTCASARKSPTSPTGASARRDPRAAEIRAQVARLKEKALARRRALRARHRAARKPPHRQPVARPLRPSGRSRPFEILPVARRRPDAHLRLRQARRHAAASSV